MTRTDVVTLMQSSRTAAEWTENERHVRRAYGGNLPGFWFAEIVDSGLAASMRFGSESVPSRPVASSPEAA